MTAPLSTPPVATVSVPPLLIVLAAGAEPFLPAAVDRAEGSPPRGNEFGAAAEERRSGRRATLRDDLDPAA
jgi:hypothetical protein